MQEKNLNFHVHSNCSDGNHSMETVVEMAHQEGVNILAITDHNDTQDMSGFREKYPDMTLIQGVEISCMYQDSQGQEREIHVIGLGFDVENEKIKEVFRKNKPNRRPYVDKILEKLSECGIDIGSYEKLQEKFPETKHLGRMQIAKMLVEKGYVKNIDEAFDIYIGAFGERRAYVKNMLRYVSIEEAVEAILDAGGVPVLCHLFYYSMSEKDNERLVQRFKELAGEKAAMEVYYGRYDAKQRQTLLETAKRYGLMSSAGSDFHSGEPVYEKLNQGFCYSLCEDLLKYLKIPK